MFNAVSFLQIFPGQTCALKQLVCTNCPLLSARLQFFHDWYLGVSQCCNKSLIYHLLTMAFIWVKSQNCGCLVTWFCYQLIAKPRNKTAAVSWPDPSGVGITSTIHVKSIISYHQCSNNTFDWLVTQPWTNQRQCCKKGPQPAMILTENLISKANCRSLKIWYWLIVQNEAKLSWKLIQTCQISWTPG